MMRARLFNVTVNTVFQLFKMLPIVFRLGSLIRKMKYYDVKCNRRECYLLRERLNGSDVMEL